MPAEVRAPFVSPCYGGPNMETTPTPDCPKCGKPVHTSTVGLASSAAGNGNILSQHVTHGCGTKLRGTPALGWWMDPSDDGD